MLLEQSTDLKGRGTQQSTCLGTGTSGRSRRSDPAELCVSRFGVAGPTAALSTEANGAVLRAIQLKE